MDRKLAASAAAWSPPASDPAFDRGAGRLSAAEYDLFARFGQMRPVYAGEAVFRHGDLGTSMFAVARGAIDFGIDTAGPPQRLGPLCYFGELGLFVGDHARRADAVAAADGTLVELRHTDLARLIDAAPELLAGFLQRAMQRIVFDEHALARGLRRRNEELQATLDRLRVGARELDRTEALVRSDELTGLANRRGLARFLAERAREGTGEGFGLILVECEGLKAINERHGHLAGDRVLRAVAHLLASASRGGDLACRLGSDAFCLLVSTTGRDEVLRYARFILDAARGLAALQGPHAFCALSLGASHSASPLDWTAAHARAEVALHHARGLGGDQVVWQGEPSLHEAAVDRGD